MKTKLITKRIHNPKLLDNALLLPSIGTLLADDCYTFLKIDDKYIHNLFPLLDDNINLQKPNYFESGSNRLLAEPASVTEFEEKTEHRTSAHLSVPEDPSTGLTSKLPTEVGLHKKSNIGAHITVIYPEENTIIEAEDINQTHRFKVLDLYYAKLDLKEYYVLLVESPSLIQLRAKYQLPPKLRYKGEESELHITIAVREFRDN